MRATPAKPETPLSATIAHLVSNLSRSSSIWKHVFVYDRGFWKTPCSALPTALGRDISRDISRDIT